MSRRFNSITVRELYEALGDMKGTPEFDLPVVVCYNYGDYHNTAAIDAIDEEPRVMLAVPEAYSQSGFGIKPIEEDVDEDDVEVEDDEQKVVVLGSHFEGGR
jgi:hypothetical protein